MTAAELTLNQLGLARWRRGQPQSHDDEMSPLTKEALPDQYVCALETPGLRKSASSVLACPGRDAAAPYPSREESAKADAAPRSAVKSRRIRCDVVLVRDVKMG